MTRMFRIKFVLLALLLPLMSAGAAHADAQVWPTSAELVRLGIRACGGDIARYCGRVFPGQGRIIQCLAEAYDDVSPPCQEFVDNVFDVRNTILACVGDAERLCPGVLPGDGRIAACLREQAEDVSKQCKDAVAGTMER